MITSEKLARNMRAGSSTVYYNNNDIEFKPFAFVLNVKTLIDVDSVEIGHEHTLRRANESEIAYINEFLQERFGTEFRRSIWENQPVSSGQEPKLPKKLWRYFVIEFKNDDPDLDLLETTFAVAPLSLEIGFAKLRVDIGGIVHPVCVYRTPSLFQSLSALNRAGANRDNLMLSLGKAEGDQIANLLQRVAAHNNKIIDLSSVIELLIELRDLPRFSTLQNLGYFAILESVLTHAPKPNDPYDSITRQITQKLALLNQRWFPELDYSQMESGHEKIWPKMYAYRSAIAHGSKPNFKSDLLILKSSDIASNLIRDVVKKVIQQAYVEPQLIADLHNV